MKEEIEFLLAKIKSPRIWDNEPVYCFTSDIDWASENVLKSFFDAIIGLNIKPTVFVTHKSQVIQDVFNKAIIKRGIHPNFLPDSSHGETFEEVIENCIKYAPEAFGFRSHRYFDVTDVTHLLKNKYNYKYVSHLCTILHPSIKPILHESGLINFPIFFEDGTHLYNGLDLNFNKYKNFFDSPGIKIISFHPMNFVMNSPTLSYMRNIKDSMTRSEYNSITFNEIKKLEYNKKGIKTTIIDIIEYVKQKNYSIFFLDEIYQEVLV